MFAVLLLGLGIAVMVVGLVADGEHIATYAWRGPLFVSLSILSFAVTIRPLGLVVSAFASFHHLRAGHAGNEVEGNHHCRHLPDDRLQSALSLCAGAAVAALPAFPDSVRA